MPPTLLHLLVYTILSLLTVLGSSAPLLGNASDNVGIYLDGTGDDLGLSESFARSGYGPPGLYSRSPADAGPSNAANTQANDVLRKYEKRGREFFLKTVLLNYDEAMKLRLQDEDYGTLGGVDQQQYGRLESLLSNGWVEHDFSNQLLQSRFMDKFARTFGKIVIGHNDRDLVVPTRPPTPYLRHPSLEVWPEGPNRLVRMIQSQPWKPSRTSPSTTARPPTMGYYDVIFNAKDGVMILLRQFSPIHAGNSDSSGPTDLFFRSSAAQSQSSVSTERRDFLDTISQESGKSLLRYGWEGSIVWYNEMQRQRASFNPDWKRYCAMPPKFKAYEKYHAPKRRDISLIIVPNVGMRNEAGDIDILVIVEACLRSTGRLSRENLPSLWEFGSFFPAGSWCFNALLATPTNQEVSRFLARHRQKAKSVVDYDDKTISGVSIVKLEGQGPQPPTLLWWIRQRKIQDAQCAAAWEGIQVGQPLPLIPNAQSSSSGKGKGKEKETALPTIPDECYTEKMKSWRSQASGSSQQAGGPSASGDPMDIDEEGAQMTPGDPMGGKSSIDVAAHDAEKALTNTGPSGTSGSAQGAPQSPGGSPMSLDSDGSGQSSRSEGDSDSPGSQQRPGGAADQAAAKASLNIGQPGPASGPSGSGSGRNLGTIPQMQVPAPQRAAGASNPQQGTRQHANDPLRAIGVLDGTSQQGGSQVQAGGQPQGQPQGPPRGGKGKGKERAQ